MSNVLIKEKKYRGQYITIKDLKKPTVISHGNNPEKDYKEAQEKGVDTPIIMHIPGKKMVQIYFAE